MINVALVGNINDTCGIATYGEDLIKYAQNDVEYYIIPVHYSLEEAILVAKNCDIIHFNHYYGIALNYSEPLLLRLSERPSVLTNHATNRAEDWFGDINILVTHEIPSKNYHKNTVVISHGIPEKDFLYIPHPDLVIAQAGFPFAWKNFWRTCSAANEISKIQKVSVKLFMPFTRRWDSQSEIDKCMSIIDTNIPISIETAWLDSNELIESLHKEASVISCYTLGSYYGQGYEGPSGSVRMAIASKRPVVINGTAPQYHDIIGYDGIYSVYDDKDLASTILTAHSNGGFAKDLIKEQSYKVISKQYRTLYQELTK